MIAPEADIRDTNSSRRFSTSPASIVPMVDITTEIWRSSSSSSMAQMREPCCVAKREHQDRGALRTGELPLLHALGKIAGKLLQHAGEVVLGGLLLGLALRLVSWLAAVSGIAVTAMAAIRPAAFHAASGG